MSALGKRRPLGAVLLLAGAGGLFVAPATAQRPPRVQALTATPALEKVFASVVTKADACTAKVFAGEQQVALATVVEPNGLLVTKASELKDGELSCELGGHRHPAQRLGQDQVSDLALLRIDAKGLAIADWNDQVPKPGAWLATPDGGPVPCGIGILSAAPYQHSLQRGYLGVQMHRESGPVRLEVVQPDSAASAAGLKPEDVILAIGDQAVSSFEQVSAKIAEHPAGSHLQLRVRRGEDELDFDVTLRTDRRGPTNAQSRIWGPLSDVRAGFATVLQHDTILNPNQCGGPLVDLDGRVIGVNIARSGRVETLALPPATVRTVVQKLRAASEAR